MVLQTAIILAGGFGTRLQSMVSDLPKPMAPVNGEPFLNYQLRYLKHFGIKKVLFSTGYLAEKIQNHYGTQFDGMTLAYVREENPMGTGGGIRLAMERCEDEYALVLNGDSFFDVDLHEFFRLHIQEEAHFSLALRKIKDAARYGTIEVDAGDRIVSFREKANEQKEGIINGGTYILNKVLYLKATQAGINFSIEKDLFEKKLREYIVKGFEFSGYFIDIGIPDDYTKAQHDLKGFTYR